MSTLAKKYRGYEGKLESVQGYNYWLFVPFIFVIEQFKKGERTQIIWFYIFRVPVGILDNYFCALC